MTRTGSFTFREKYMPVFFGCRLLSVCVLAVCVLGGCERKSSFLKDDVGYFREMLRADMDYDELVASFGVPPEDINAAYAAEDGLHIYQYPLYDSTFVRIGFTSRMEYACLVDAKFNIFEDVIVIPRDER